MGWIHAMNLVSKISAQIAATPTPPGLVHVPDGEPAITRRRCGQGFSHRHPDGASPKTTDLCVMKACVLRKGIYWLA